MSKDTIVVYPRFGQMTSIWCVNKAQGCYNIPLLQSVDNNSLVLFNLDNNHLHVINHTLVEGKVAFNIGDEVAISEEIGTYAKYVNGKIKSIQNDYIEIVAEIENKTRTYRVMDYKQIAVNQESTDSHVQVDLTELSGNLQLSYLFNNIGWGAHYNIVFNDNKIELFKMVGKIYNNNKKLSGDVVLVAGNISKPRQDMVTRSMMTEVASDQKLGMTEGKFEEHYRYNVGSQCIKDTLNIDLIAESGIESTKYYIHDMESYDQVAYGYRLLAPKFLPEGDMYLYHRSNNDIMYFGTSRIKETREGTKVSFTVGATTQVKIESVVQTSTTSVTPDDTHTQELQNVLINTTLKNLTGKLAVVILRYYVGNDKVISTNQEPTKRENRYLVWELTLVPTDKITLMNINLEILK